MFLFENVKGLLNHDNGKTYDTIINVFNDEGYDILYKVLNANDYNVPQKLERLITIGIRKDLKDKYIYNFPEIETYKPILKDIVLDVNPNKDTCYRYSKQKEYIFLLIPSGGYWKDLKTEIAKQYMKKSYNMGGGRTGILRRLSLEEPSLTVLTSPMMNRTDRCHPIEIRPFSYRENARIQTFPDDWEFCGSLMSKYKQVGNAVPVNLAERIGLSILQTLNME